jgi:hypothetical protein
VAALCLRETERSGTPSEPLACLHGDARTPLTKGARQSGTAHSAGAKTLSLCETERSDTPSEPLACVHGDAHIPAHAACSPVLSLREAERSGTPSAARLPAHPGRTHTHKLTQRARQSCLARSEGAAVLSLREKERHGTPSEPLACLPVRRR